jgi:hypothetical protein
MQGCNFNMTRFLTLATTLLMFASAFATTSFAQMSDDCNRQAEELCANEPIVRCMRRSDLMNAMGQECMGDLQTMIEMDREARAEQAEQAEQDEAFERNAQRATQDDTMRGVSYGGILRAGPGMDYAKVASLQEGDPIDILEDTGIWFNEYKWYRVQTARGSGYHWGGIFCIQADTQFEGIFQKC